jgi:hypothetical protein
MKHSHKKLEHHKKKHDHHMKEAKKHHHAGMKLAKTLMKHEKSEEKSMSKKK